MIQPHFLRMRMARLVLSASICAVPQGAWAQNRVEPHLQYLFETAEAHNASLQSLEAASREAQAAVETAKAERLLMFRRRHRIAIMATPACGTVISVRALPLLCRIGATTMP